MRGGCLFGFARMIGRGCLRLGEILASIMLRSLAFLLLFVVGPLFLGMTREVLRRIFAGLLRGRGDDPSRPPGTGLGFALAGGVLWTLAYIVLRAMFGLLSRGSGVLFYRVLPTGPPFLQALLVPGLFLVAGAAVGALAFRYEGGFRS